MDLEKRVEKLEEKVEGIETNINGTLTQIKLDVTEIKACLKSSGENGDLKNQLIEQRVKTNSSRIEKLEANQSKLVWIIITEIIGITITVISAGLKLL